MENIDWNLYTNNTSEFSLNGEKILGKCVNVYDGDTVKIVLNLRINDKLYKWNCRIARVDTPEIRTRNKQEKEMGYIVRDKLREKILDKIIMVKCLDFDKYGRLLVEIYEIKEDDTKCNISDWLIDNNYAYVYNGGTKKSWF